MLEETEFGLLPVSESPFWNMGTARLGDSTRECADNFRTLAKSPLLSSSRRLAYHLLLVAWQAQPRVRGHRLHYICNKRAVCDSPSKASVSLAVRAYGHVYGLFSLCHIPFSNEALRILHGASTVVVSVPGDYDALDTDHPHGMPTTGIYVVSTNGSGAR